MRTMKPVVFTLLGGTLLGSLACSDSPNEPSETEEPGIEFVSLPFVIDLTPDGSVALLMDFGHNIYFYHTATRELELKTNAGFNPGDFATAISANGVVTASYGSPVTAAFWTQGAEWTSIPSAYVQGCDDIAGAWDVSAGGNVVVGLVWNKCDAEAFRWDSKGTGIMTPLQRIGASFPGSSHPPTNRASKISDDGSLMGGFAQTDLVDRWPAVWKADGTGLMLPGTQPDTPGEVLSISADGNMVAGTWGSNAFYWTEATGTVDMGQLPGSDPFDPQYPNAVSAGGDLIFGGAGSPFFSLPRAWVWTLLDGMRPLADVLAAANVDVPTGYLLTNVLAASQDGTVVLGVAYDPVGNQVGFVLRAPVSVYGL